MVAEKITQAEAIARLNDRARQAMGLACRMMVTQGFLALRPKDQSCARELVETFDAFTQDNDPHGERDFGAIYQTSEVQWTSMKPAEPTETIFWKIDYFDLSLEWASEDPANPAITIRILTIMLADEY
jgi:Protein of unknown function (DUF3768)